jgi:AcrR family transcriptional regulator
MSKFSDRVAAPTAAARQVTGRGELQRQRILTTLAELLESRSINDLAVNEISSAAGVKRSGYYSYFSSKYAPLAVLAADIWSETVERAASFVRHDNERVNNFLDRVQADHRKGMANSCGRADRVDPGNPARRTTGGDVAHAATTW